MDSQSLTLLVEIIDSGNLSQAARKLKMTRANVSYHLTQLEKAAGVQLVKRTTRRVEPTEIGLRLYEHGRNIHNEMLAAREAITTLGQSLQGRVGIDYGVYGVQLHATYAHAIELYPPCQTNAIGRLHRCSCAVFVFDA